MLRNQLAYIQSLYLEMQRQFRLPAVDAYVKQCLASGHASGMFLDYGALYDHALAVFRRSEVRLLSYEALAAAGPDMTRTFLDALGLRPAGLEHRAAAGGRSNVSPRPALRLGGQPCQRAAHRPAAARRARDRGLRRGIRCRRRLHPLHRRRGRGDPRVFRAGEPGDSRRATAPSIPGFALAPVALRHGARPPRPDRRALTGSGSPACCMRPSRYRPRHKPRRDATAAKPPH